MKCFKYDDTEFSIFFPDSWTIARDMNLISLYDPNDGVGVLQFSVFYVDENKIVSLKSELADFLEGKHLNFKISSKTNYAYCWLTENETFWQYWLFRKRNIIVFVTYNCKIIDVGAESETIEKIIESAIGRAS